MCHEGWAQRRREQEEARRLWDLYNRETTEPPARREPEIELEQEKADTVQEREPVTVER